MKQKTKKQLTYWLSVAVVGIALGLGLQFVRAWTEPSQAPPNGNVGAPINTEANVQEKGDVTHDADICVWIGGLKRCLGTVTPTLFCGDLKCNNGETCSTCSKDCGDCAPPPPVLACDMKYASDTHGDGANIQDCYYQPASACDMQWSSDTAGDRFYIQDCHQGSSCSSKWATDTRGNGFYYNDCL